MSNVYLDPSPPEEDWPADTDEAVFSGRVLKSLPDDDLWKGLRSGELHAVGVRVDRRPTRISPDRFYSGNREAVLGWFQIDLPDNGPRYARRKVTIPFWIFVTKESLTAYLRKIPGATVATEARAKAFLAERLRADPDMKREDARKLCEGRGISDQGFEDRVWPDARELAGLPRLGRAGAKPKSRS